MTTWGSRSNVVVGQFKVVILSRDFFPLVSCLLPSFVHPCRYQVQKGRNRSHERSQAEKVSMVGGGPVVVGVVVSSKQSQAST